MYAWVPCLFLGHLRCFQPPDQDWTALKSQIFVLLMDAFSEEGFEVLAALSLASLSRSHAKYARW